MHNIKIFLAIFLLANSVNANTKPIHFEVGDINPNQKKVVNINPQQWPGYLDVKCDIIDPSHSAIIRISYNNFVEIIQLNQDKYDQYGSMPLQISLKAQQTNLTLFKSHVYGLGSDEITFQNLDDDMTISVKNCEVSPNALLSKDLIYFPSTIRCSNNHCDMQGSSSEIWNDFTAADDTYDFSSVVYINGIAEAAYYNKNFTSSTQLTPKNKLEPYRDIYTAWGGGTAGAPIQCGIDVIKCPLTKSN